MLIGIPEIATAAGVGTSAVGNWRKRHPDFPTPRVQAPSGALFDLREVERWLLENSKIDGPIPRELLFWRTVESLRSNWTAEQLTSFLRAGLVYLHACSKEIRSASPHTSVVPYRYRWETIRETADAGLLDALKQASEAIEGENGALKDLITGGIAPSPEPEPTVVRASLDAIQELVHDGTTRAQLFEDLSQRAESADRFRGAHATPEVLSNLLTALVGPVHGLIIDPAVGEGRLLLAATKNAQPGSSYLGYELVQEPVLTGRSRFFLHDLDVQLNETDVFRVPVEELPAADLVLLDPPFGQRIVDADILSNKRWAYGAPPASSADFAWLQLAVEMLKPGGKAAVLQTPRSMTSGGKEAQVRSAMLTAGVVEAAIALPSRLRQDTSIPLAVWLLRHPLDATTSEVLLIDGSNLGEAGRSQHSLHDSDIETLRRTVEAFRTASANLSEPGTADIAWIVPVSKILEQDSDLTPSRYRPRRDVNLSALTEEVEQRRSRLSSIESGLSASIRSLVLRLNDHAAAIDSATTATSTRTTLGDVATLMRGTVPAKPTDTGVPFFGLAEITSGGGGTQRFVSRDQIGDKSVKLETDDVVVALLGNVGRTSLVKTNHVGAVLGRECVALRSTGPTVSGAWLSAWTKSNDFETQVERNTSGTTMPRLNVKTLATFTLPVPTDDAQGRAEQERVAGMAASFEKSLRSASELLNLLQDLERAEFEILFARIAAGGTR